MDEIPKMKAESKKIKDQIQLCEDDIARYETEIKKLEHREERVFNQITAITREVPHPNKKQAEVVIPASKD